MNKRIKQLIEEASGDDWRGDKLNAVLLVELVVRECADLFVDQKYMILNPHEPFANERVRALKEHDKYTVKKIKKHFGVEE